MTGHASDALCLVCVRAVWPHCRLSQLTLATGEMRQNRSSGSDNSAVPGSRSERSLSLNAAAGRSPRDHQPHPADYGGAGGSAGSGAFLAVSASAWAPIKGGRTSPGSMHVIAGSRPRRPARSSRRRTRPQGPTASAQWEGERTARASFRYPDAAFRTMMVRCCRAAARLRWHEPETGGLDP